jgi:hypothetical protein
MRIGAGLMLIAVGAILRFGIFTVSTHGVAIHTIGDILMLVGVLGVVLWLVVWAPWNRSPAGTPPTGTGTNTRAELPADTRRRGCANRCGVGRPG